MFMLVNPSRSLGAQVLKTTNQRPQSNFIFKFPGSFLSNLVLQLFHIYAVFHKQTNKKKKYMQCSKLRFYSVHMPGA